MALMRHDLQRPTGADRLEASQDIDRLIAYCRPDSHLPFCRECRSDSHLPKEILALFPPHSLHARSNATARALQEEL
jgi:hypothetical protein